MITKSVSVNAQFSNEFFFQKYDVATIRDHSNIGELALHYDNESVFDKDGRIVDTTLSHYVTDDEALDLAAERLSRATEPQEALNSYC